ncbi:MAG: flagellar hook-length control protein FliK [Proteobacteria bacterium]|nr:flagellar hook-length control protein FliK [Pseudomonadota bacterium]
MVQTAGVLVGAGLADILAPAAGDGVVGAGSTGGVGGLFGALLAEGVDAEGLVAQDEGGLASLLGAGAVAQPQALDFFKVDSVKISATFMQTLQLGNGPVVPVQGEPAVVQQFIGKVQELYAQLVVEGGLTMKGAGDADELASALTKLGMAPEEAEMLAGRITTMLEILDQQQDLSDEELGTLAMMMLAASQKGEQGQGFVLQFVSVEHTVVQQEVSMGAFAAQRQVSLSKLSVAQLTWDVSRDVLGIESVQNQGGDEAQPVLNKALIDPLVSEDGEPQLFDVRKPKELMVRVAEQVENPEIVVELPVLAAPEPKQVAMPVEVKNQPVVVGDETSRLPVVGLMAKDVVEAPKGDVIYKYVEDKRGVEVLKTVQPLEDVSGARVMLEQPLRHEILAAAPREHSHAASFAERLEQAQQAQAGQQVVVQMKPLIEQGGGVVRVVLNPVELGEIRIELSVVDGKVQGSMSATQPATLEQLARDLHSLRHGLAEAGLKLGEQGINLMLSNQNNGQQQFANQQAFDQQAARQAELAGSAQPNGGDDVADDVAPVRGRWVSPERMLDIEA